MGIDFNKKSDEWVSEITRCMTSRGLCFGDAVRFLMQQRADSPPEVIELPDDPEVMCPACKFVMLQSEYARHWSRKHQV